MHHQPKEATPLQEAIRAMQDQTKSLQSSSGELQQQSRKLWEDYRYADRGIKDLQTSVNAQNAITLKMFRVMAFVIVLEALLIGALSVIAYQALRPPERTSRALWFDREDLPSVQINVDNEAIFLGTDSHEHAERYRAWLRERRG